MDKDSFPIQYVEPDDSYYQFVVDESVVADASSIDELNKKVREFYRVKDKRIQELESAIREHKVSMSGQHGEGEANDMKLWSVLTEDKK